MLSNHVTFFFLYEWNFPGAFNWLAYIGHYIEMCEHDALRNPCGSRREGQHNHIVMDINARKVKARRIGTTVRMRKHVCHGELVWDRLWNKEFKINSRRLWKSYAKGLPPAMITLPFQLSAPPIFSRASFIFGNSSLFVTTHLVFEIANCFTISVGV